MTGTHVGIIGNVATPGRVLTGEIQRVMSELSSRRPFLPLVLHHGQGGGSDEAARDHARTLPDWRVEGRTERDADIGAACHILIVIAPGRENDLSSQERGLWSLAEKARVSGRTIIHVPVTLASAEVPPQPLAPKLRKAPQYPKGSLAWALSKGYDDRKARTVSQRYTDFRKANGLPDSPQSLKQWEAYKKAAGVVRKPASAVSRQRTRDPFSRTRLMKLEALKERNEAALRKLNPTDPDVWR